MNRIEDSPHHSCRRIDHKGNRQEQLDLVAFAQMAGFADLQHVGSAYCYRLPDLESRNHEDRRLRIELDFPEPRSRMRCRYVADPDLDRIHNTKHIHDHSTAGTPPVGLCSEVPEIDPVTGSRKAHPEPEDVVAAG